jgi:hypothetical protein
MYENLKRIADAAQSLHDPVTPCPTDVRRGSNEHYVFLELRAARDLDETACKAMLDVEWPEGMSAADQMRALFKAGINAIIGNPDDVQDP